ncbi:MAG: hypothetical protein IPK99_08130 [Flavobacteriales bacterium]|nr:hypothetical protein [Flavobacteriales bacterium]
MASAATITIIGIGFSGPFLAVNRPYGHGSLVLEGWLPEASLREAYEVFKKGRYDRLILTGSIRPVSHHLRGNEALIAPVEMPVRTDVMVRVAGLPGVRWNLYEDHELVLSATATAEPKDFHFVLVRPGHHTWRLGPDSAAHLAATSAFALFVGDWQMNGRSLHEVADSLWIADSAGGSRPAPRDHATQAALILATAGMDPATTIILPVAQERPGRTTAAAQRFAQFAVAQSIDTCDVLTLGVHARRTWSAFREACDPSVAVGIVALNDPDCSAEKPGQWARCWSLRAKEVIGLIASSAD